MQTFNISNDLMFEIYENAPAIIAYHDLQQRIVWANKAYRQALGISVDDLDGQACYQLWGLKGRCRDCPVTRAITTGEPAEAELTPVTQDDWPEDQGSWLVRSAPVRDENGRIMGAVETAFEITERKRAELERLEESEERYRSIFEQAGDGIFIMDRYGSFKDCNPAVCSMLGYQREELLTNNFVNLIPSDSLTSQALPQDMVSEGEHVRIERELLCKSGRRRTMEESLVELHTGELLLVLRDITDRKQMERELAKERGLLRAIIDKIPVMITHYDPESNMLYLNKEFERIIGWTTDEVQDIDMMEKVYPDPDYRRQVWEYMKKATCEWREFRVQSKHGDLIDSEWSNIFLDDGTQVGIGIDVRERKRAEEYIHRKSEEQALLLESIPVQLWYLKDPETYGAVNQAHADFLGLSKQAIEHKPLQAFFPDKVVQACMAENIEVFETKKPVSTEEWVHDAQGNQCLLAITKTPKLNKDNEVEYVVCSAGDITEYRVLEQNLRRSENYYRTIFETSGSPMFIIEEDTTISLVNVNFERLSGYTRQEIEGVKSWTEFVHPDDIEWRKRNHYLRRKHPQSGPIKYELRFLTRNNELRYGYLFVDIIPYTTQSVASLIDITEQKRAKELIHESEERFKTILENIPGGIFAHDLDGNMLMINNKASENTGYTQEELLNMTVWDIDIYAVEREDQITLWQSLETGESATVESFHAKKDGTHYPAEIHLNSIVLDGQPCILAIAFDITERKQMEEKLKELSIRDSLTGLYNRNFFEEEMKRLSDGRHSPAGIVVCDVDGLKFINDTLGHQAGDQLLQNVAGILRENFRQSDIIARIGGDEFAVIFTRADWQIIDDLLQRLRQAIRYYNRDRLEIPLSLSLGSAVGEMMGPDIYDLFREADNRMYREKIQQEGSARSAILQALTVSMEARDFSTNGHCDRLQTLAVTLSRSLDLPHEFENDLTLLARFHDIGKVGISDHLLYKPHVSG